MATSLEISKKRSRSIIYTQQALFEVKIAKIGPADLQIMCLREIIKPKNKKEITEGKIYSPFGKFAERAKKRRQKAQTKDQ